VQARVHVVTALTAGDGFGHGHGSWSDGDRRS
jgi:hypothetical protein